MKFYERLFLPCWQRIPKEFKTGANRFFSLVIEFNELTPYASICQPHNLGLQPENITIRMESGVDGSNPTDVDVIQVARF